MPSFSLDSMVNLEKNSRVSTLDLMGRVWHSDCHLLKKMKNLNIKQDKSRHKREHSNVHSVPPDIA